MPSSARFPPLPGATSPCLDVFGRNGSWVQDWNYSANSNYGQYREPRAVPSGTRPRSKMGMFQANQSDAPYRWETSWKWVAAANDDDSTGGGTSPSSSCPQIDYTMTETKVCHLLQNLGVRRVLFFGDSLTHSMFASFVNLLHPSRHAVQEENETTTAFFSQHEPESETTIVTIHCSCNFGKCSTPTDAVTTTNTTVVEIPILQLRNHGGQPYPNHNRENFVFDNYTRDFISSSPERTLAIFNLGAHYHKDQHYKEDLEKLLLVLDELHRPQDLYFFRTSVPGHPRCQPTNPRTFNYTKGFRIVPLADFEDYKAHMRNNKYNWTMMFDFIQQSHQASD
jgi:hypothetical protein